MPVASRWKAGVFCVVGGLCFTGPALGAGHFGWWWMSGVLISAALLPVVRLGPRGAWAQFGVMAAVLIVVGLVCTLSEAVLFYPETKMMLMPALAGGAAFYAIAAAALALIARLLRLPSTSGIHSEHRSVAVAIPLVVLGALSYVLYYLVFGAITFQFFTRQFYPHAVEQTAALGYWFWVYQFGRGLLMTLAVLPVIYSLRMPRGKAALAVGLMIWIVGGGASLLVPSTLMVPAQRYMHILEIMTQNVSLGMTAGWLLRSKTKPVADPVERPVTA